jgi:hypothetical protein
MIACWEHGNVMNIFLRIFYEKRTLWYKISPADKDYVLYDRTQNILILLTNYFARIMRSADRPCLLRKGMLTEGDRLNG